jgi:hypothetical protein
MVFSQNCWDPIIRINEEYAIAHHEYRIVYNSSLEIRRG